MKSHTGYGEIGYELMHNVFSKDHLGVIAQSLRAALMKGNPDMAELSLDELILAREAKDHSLVYKASQSLGSSYAAYNLLGSGILNAVCELAGFHPAELHIMPMYLIVQLPGDERFDYAWHQDGAYYDWCDEFAALWFPVNRSVTAGTGTISVVPRSHCEGRRASDTYFRDGSFRQIEARLGEQEAEQERVIELELGDCCLMDGNLVHRSVTNRSATPRVAGVVRLAHLAKVDTTSVRLEVEQIHLVGKWGRVFLGALIVRRPAEWAFSRKG
jgi:hypothetical protein